MRATQRGFTLIEVLVAFLVLTLAVSVLFRILSGGLRNIERSQQYARAATLAESLLAETGISEPLDGETEGRSADGQFHWLRQVEPYLPWETALRPSPYVRGFRVQITVQWDSGQNRQQLMLQTIRLERERMSTT